MNLRDKKTINIKLFLEQKQLFFDSEKKALGWVKRNLKPQTFIKAGPNYLVNSEEIERCFNEYIQRQELIYKIKVERVKELRDRKKMSGKSETN